MVGSLDGALTAVDWLLGGRPLAWQLDNAAFSCCWAAAAGVEAGLDDLKDPSPTLEASGPCQAWVCTADNNLQSHNNLQSQ